MKKIIELYKKKKGLFNVIISVSLFMYLTFAQYLDYIHIMKDQSFTVCQTVKYTDKYISYTFMVDSTIYEQKTKRLDPYSTHEEGICFLLLYYTKNPKVNTILYDEVWERSYYGKKINYPFKVSVSFWDLRILSKI